MAARDTHSVRDGLHGSMLHTGHRDFSGACQCAPEPGRGPLGLLVAPCLLLYWLWRPGNGIKKFGLLFSFHEQQITMA